MKIKLIRDAFLVGGIVSFETSESHAIIKGGTIVHLKLKEDMYDLLIDEPTDFTIRRLYKGIEFKPHKFSNYIIQIKRPSIEHKSYFAGLNHLQYLMIRYNKDESSINKSNIHKLAYVIIGSIIGSTITLLLKGFC